METWLESEGARCGALVTDTPWAYAVTKAPGELAGEVEALRGLGPRILSLSPSPEGNRIFGEPWQEPGAPVQAIPTTNVCSWSPVPALPGPWPEALQLMVSALWHPVAWTRAGSELEAEPEALARRLAWPVRSPGTYSATRPITSARVYPMLLLPAALPCGMLSF